MYCPRCGSPNPDATKFCRQCGLALTQLTGYVASGGTAVLTGLIAGQIVDCAIKRILATGTTSTGIVPLYSERG